jgi:hypothetical protein
LTHSSTAGVVAMAMVAMRARKVERASSGRTGAAAVRRARVAVVMGERNRRAGRADTAM